MSARDDVSTKYVGPAFLGIDLPRGRTQPSLWRWVVGTIVAIGLSLLACFVIVALARVLFPATAGYEHFQFRDYSRLTIIGVFGACLGWPIAAWLSSHARRLYLWLAIIVTLVLLAPDVWILHLGQPAAAVAALVVMHLALAIITYPAMIFIAPQRIATADNVIPR